MALTEHMHCLILVLLLLILFFFLLILVSIPLFLLICLPIFYSIVLILFFFLSLYQAVAYSFFLLPFWKISYTSVITTDSFSLILFIQIFLELYLKFLLREPAPPKTTPTPFPGRNHTPQLTLIIIQNLYAATPG